MSNRMRLDAGAIARESATLRWTGLVTILLAGTAVSQGIAREPWLLTGLICGALVLLVAIGAPIALLGAMLALGALDLSFMTGGFKSLLPHMGGLDMNGIRLIGATVGFSVFILNARAAHSAIVGSNGRYYLAFLAFALLTLVNSLDPLEGLRLGLKLAYPFLTFLLVIGLCDTEEKIEKLTVCALAAAALIVFVINPLFTLDGGARIDPEGFRRVRGIGAHENPFSFYLMIMMFIAFARLVFRRRLRYLIFCLGAAVWITLTLTRITFLAAIAGLLVITLLAALAQRQYRALAAGLIVTLAVAVPGLPFILERSLGFVPTAGELGTLITHPTALYESINWQGRTNLWPIVWSGFMAAPIMGLGLGSSGAVIAQHFPAEAAAVAHNEYLRLAADAGIIGVLLFAMAMVRWLITAVRATLRENRRVAEYAVAACAAIVGLAIVAITDNPFDYYMPYTQYVGFLMGATVAMTRVARNDNVDHRLS
jgi:O-antigen ligase